jgi:hypothetical protein
VACFLPIVFAHTGFSAEFAIAGFAITALCFLTALLSSRRRRPGAGVTQRLFSQSKDRAVVRPAGSMPQPELPPARTLPSPAVGSVPPPRRSAASSQIGFGVLVAAWLALRDGLIGSNKVLGA